MSKKYASVDQWLSRVRNINHRLDTLQTAKQAAYERACSSRHSRSDIAAQDKILQYVTLSEKVDHYAKRLRQARAEILDVLKQIEDTTLQTLLIEHYINGKSWDTKQQKDKSLQKVLHLLKTQKVL